LDESENTNNTFQGKDNIFNCLITAKSTKQSAQKKNREKESRKIMSSTSNTRMIFDKVSSS